MRVRAFIPDWPAAKCRAAEIANVVTRYCPTTILNDPNDYFNAQWEKARQQLDADVLLWIMADVHLPDGFGQMFNDAARIMSRGDVGWYAPDIEWTSYIYNKEELRELESGIYEVPNTDSLCFFVRADVVKAMPFIDPQKCFMWGVDFVAVATARLMGLKVVRDYKFKASHPNDTGYSIDRASEEMGALWKTLHPALKDEVKKVVDETNLLKVIP